MADRCVAKRCNRAGRGWSFGSMGAGAGAIPRVHDCRQEVGSVWNTLFLTTVVSLFIGLTVSIGVYDKNGIYISSIRTCYYLPVVVSTVVMAMFWSFLLNPASGLIPYLMGNMALFALNNQADTWIPIPTTPCSRISRSPSALPTACF